MLGNLNAADGIRLVEVMCSLEAVDLGTIRIHHGSKREAGVHVIVVEIFNSWKDS